ncbi:hypothetical protein, partial [Mesorhizobium sp.]|uniref:hypothetical protein n=1 Tax=Mesorhizobium sp. TaxID=1871066 RepID=UPI0025C4C887
RKFNGRLADSRTHEQLTLPGASGDGRKLALAKQPPRLVHAGGGIGAVDHDTARGMSELDAGSDRVEEQDAEARFRETVLGPADMEDIEAGFGENHLRRKRIEGEMRNPQDGATALFARRIEMLGAEEFDLGSP